MHFPKNRWLAFAIHFGISLGIFFILALLIVLGWYPGALFPAAGGWQGIRIVIGVDLVLGPLLTLIVYNISKPRHLLYRDLCVIGLIQLSCLAAGVFIIYNERPVFVTYAHDQFYTLKRSEFAQTDTDLQKLEVSWLRPTFFYVELPEEKALADVTVMLIGMTGKQLVLQTKKYRPFPRSMEKVEAVMSNSLVPADFDTQKCVPVMLTTAFNKGTACLDVMKQRFSDFTVIEEEKEQ